MALSSQETIDIYLVAVLVFTMASMSAISNETLLGSTTRFPAEPAVLQVHGTHTDTQDARDCPQTGVRAV